MARVLAVGLIRSRGRFNYSRGVLERVRYRQQQNLHGAPPAAVTQTKTMPPMTVVGWWLVVVGRGGPCGRLCGSYAAASAPPDFTRTLYGHGSGCAATRSAAPTFGSTPDRRLSPPAAIIAPEPVTAASGGRLLVEE